jgi:hypothetical protein
MYVWVEKIDVAGKGTGITDLVPWLLDAVTNRLKAPAEFLNRIYTFESSVVKSMTEDTPFADRSTGDQLPVHGREHI